MHALIRTLALVALFTVGVLTVGCQNQPGSSTKDAPKLYDVTGTVVSLDREKKKVTLDHEDIPGLMKAMKMDFAVSEANVLDGISAGDRVAGKLKADGGTYVVTSLEKR